MNIQALFLYLLEKYREKWGKGDTLTLNPCISIPFDKIMHPIFEKLEAIIDNIFPIPTWRICHWILPYVSFYFLDDQNALLPPRDKHGPDITALPHTQKPHFATHSKMHIRIIQKQYLMPIKSYLQPIKGLLWPI